MPFAKGLCMKKFSFLFLFGVIQVPLIAMEKPAIYHIPATANKVLQEVSYEQLLSIKSEQELADQGTIVSLVIRPDKNQRQIVPSLQLTREFIIGDKNEKEEKDREFGAVTMMRADVARALGGYHIPGDNIHVEGLRFGKKYLDTGDLVVIKNRDQEIKSVLLKTLIPHYACWKLQARCGSHAHDLLNAEGEYERGIIHDGNPVDGLEDRLRGIRLVVLKAGEVTCGDHVAIARGSEKQDLMAQFHLEQVAAAWIEKSKALAEKLEKEEAAKMASRKQVRVKKMAQK